MSKKIVVKKVIFLLISVLLMSSLFSTIAFAADFDVNGLIEKTNTAIQNDIYEAMEKANQEILQSNLKIDQEFAKVETGMETLSEATQKVEKINADLQMTLKKVIDNLLEKTGKITAEAIEKSEKYGITLVSEWIPVQIGDQTILIDPFYVG